MRLPHSLAVFVLFALAFTPGRAAPAANETNTLLHSTTVAYRENHDPSVIWLEDGRKLSVVYGAIKWEDVEQWQKGRPLDLGYSATQGLVLMDPASRKSIPVISGWGEAHPLDLLLRRELETAANTMAMVEAYDASVARWKAEVARLYHFYATQAKLGPPALAAVTQQRQAWERMTAAHLKLLVELNRMAEGTFWKVKAGEYANALFRGHALQLTEMLEIVSTIAHD